MEQCCREERRGKAKDCYNALEKTLNINVASNIREKVDEDGLILYNETQNVHRYGIIGKVWQITAMAERNIFQPAVNLDNQSTTQL